MTNANPTDVTTPWPFADWHRHAVRDLGLSPDDFWALPLRLWLDLLGSNTPALSRTALRDLMKEYPDETE